MASKQPSRLRVITLANPKGGVGKTTICSALAVRAAEESRRVALLDLDPQESLACGPVVARRRTRNCSRSMRRDQGQRSTQQRPLSASDLPRPRPCRMPIPSDRLSNFSSERVPRF